jgi:membrane-bound serine protease (ClpP class)
MQDLNQKVHTVAFVDSEAISAGALISVACEDIIMRPATKIGDCAPITMGGQLEGVEREKSESFIRASFRNAAEANNYPPALLEAMVTQAIEVHRVMNNDTGEYEFFKKEDLPKDDNGYDIEGAELVDTDSEILTLIASDAVRYGVARIQADSIGEALRFLAERDGITFSPMPLRFETNWSEELVRWINNPAVMGVLVMLAMLGVYMEMSSPGLGLPGLVAVVCVAIIIGSKYIAGMANWVEIAIFALGLLLLALEIFVIPGFGVAGASGIICIMIGLFGMLIRNAPDQIPWPTTDFDWQILTKSLIGVFAGFTGFVIIAAIIAKYIPRSEFLSALMLKPAFTPDQKYGKVSMTSPPEHAKSIKIGDRGLVNSPLRPSGTAEFDGAVVDVVAYAEFIENGVGVEITEIHGNRVVVKKTDE